MSLKVLSSRQIDQFIRDGFTVLRQAFPREVASDIRRAVLTHINASEDDPRTWTQRRVHVTKAFQGEPFMSACTDAFTPPWTT